MNELAAESRTLSPSCVRTKDRRISGTCVSNSWRGRPHPTNVPTFAVALAHSEHRPLRARENFEISGAKTSKSLKKSRAARAVDLVAMSTSRFGL